jgi:predicted Rossmann-fold nucleotide-binding protein
MKRICVFCGAAEGARPAYADAARELGASWSLAGSGSFTAAAPSA